MLLAVPYLLVTDVCVRLIADGGPGWLHLVVLVCIWNALKMLWIGPISVVLRRSTDGGATWGPQTVVRAGSAAGGYGDPSGRSEQAREQDRLDGRTTD